MEFEALFATKGVCSAHVALGLMIVGNLISEERFKTGLTLEKALSDFLIIGFLASLLPLGARGDFRY